MSMLFQTPQRIITGVGCFAQLPEEVKRLGADRVLLVIDPFLVQNGFAAGVVKALEAVGVAAVIFDAIEPDPRCEIPMDAAKLARDHKSGAIVAVGGGSTLDIAKVAALLATDPVDVRDMVGINKVRRAGLPTILIPTTAGTGSEVTTVAILSDEQAHLKVGIVSPFMLATTVLLDAELTCGLPRGGTAASGVDALIHAIEAFTGNTATPHTDLYARDAIRLIVGNIRRAWSYGHDMAARDAMLIGSFYAGLAFSNSGCAAVHAFAYPIGAEFHIPHGIANAIMLIPVLRMTIPSRLERYAELATLLGENVDGLSLRDAAFRCVPALEALFADLRIDRHLASHGVGEQHIAGIADSVMKVTRLLGNNPYTITRADAETIYREAL